jgi:iron complex transport system ATP-binding protein
MIEASGITVSLAGRRVLRDVDIALEAGATLGLIGPNGAGKSTLLRVLAGLLEPEAGRIAVDGRPLAAWPRRTLARAVAFLPQGQECHWPLTVARLVALGRLPHLGLWQGPREDDRRAIEAAMDAADVAGLAERRVTALSGGERARALLARALAVGARVLLADEPVAGLDPYHQLQVMEVLRATARAGTAVMAVLHDLTLAARFCDSVAVLHDGALIALGPPAEAMAEATLAAAFGIEVVAGEEDGERYLVPWRRRAPADRML